MKKLVLLLAGVAFMAGTVSTSFGQVPDKESVKARENLMEEKKDVVVATQEVKIAKVDSISDYQKLTKESEIKFKSNAKCVSDLRASITSGDSKDKIANQKKVSLLEEKNSNLKQELTDYKVVGQTEFATFKLRFNKDLDELAKDLKDFKVI